MTIVSFSCYTVYNGKNINTICAIFIFLINNHVCLIAVFFAINLLCAFQFPMCVDFAPCVRAHTRIA